MPLEDSLNKSTYKDITEFRTALAEGVRDEIKSAVAPLLSEIANLKSQIASTTTSPTSTPTPTPTPTPPVTQPTVTPTPTPTPVPNAAVFAFVNPITLSNGSTIGTPATPKVTGNGIANESGVIQYPVGSQVTVDVTGIDSNVNFDGWRLDSINGPVVSGTTPYTTDVPVDGLTLIATFKEKLQQTSTGGGGGGGGGPTNTGDLGGGEFNPIRLFR